MTNARPAADAAPSTGANAVSKILTFGALPVVLVICIIVFQIGNPRFLSGPNVLNMVQQGVFLMLIAFGQMLVLLAGGFDLSVGAVVALTSIVSAKVMVAMSLAYPEAPGLAIAAGFLAAVVVGIVCGGVNGFGVAILKVNAFIVTLATASIFAGVTLVISQGNPGVGLTARLRLRHRLRLFPRPSCLALFRGSSRRRRFPAGPPYALWPLHLRDRLKPPLRSRRGCQHQSLPDGLLHALCHDHGLCRLAADGPCLLGRADAWR